MRRLKKILAVVGLLMALGLVVIEFTMVRFYSSGFFHVTVAIQSEPGAIRSLRWTTDYGRRPREKLLDDAVSLDRYYENTGKSDPYDGQPFKVLVDTDTSYSPLGRMISWSQYDALVLLVEMSDGRKIEKIVPIPDGRTTHTMAIEIR